MSENIPVQTTEVQRPKHMDDIRDGHVTIIVMEAGRHAYIERIDITDKGITWDYTSAVAVGLVRVARNFPSLELSTGKHWLKIRWWKGSVEDYMTSLQNHPGYADLLKLEEETSHAD